MTPEEIDASPMLYGMLTRYHCCPTSDGSAAAVLMSEKAVKERGLEHQAVEILAQAMTSDMPGTRDPENTEWVPILTFPCFKNFSAV